MIFDSADYVSEDTILAMPIDILFDFAAVHVIGEHAATANMRIDFVFTDLDETWTVWVSRGVLNAREGASREAQGGRITLDGDESVLQTYGDLLDTFDPNFAMVTP